MTFNNVSINSDGSGNSIIMNDREVVVNGIKYPVPGRGYNTSMIDGKIYVNGYELKNGKWKKTLRAMYHKYF